jgi:hypothetical protein
MRDNQQAMKLSRRTIIASLAAGAAANVPVIAAVAGSDHPDRELLELGREYFRLRAAERAADEHSARCYEAYEKVEPAPSDALRHRIQDHLVLHLPVLDTCRGGISSDVGRNDLYSMSEIQRLERTPPASPPLVQEQRARIAEIQSAFERWNVECEEVAEEFGVWEARDVTDEIVASLRSLEKRFAAMHATTREGLQMRAMVLAEIFGEAEEDEDDTDQLMIRAIVRDLCAMTGQSV